MIVLVEQLETDPDEAEVTKNVIGEVIADHCGQVRRMFVAADGRGLRIADGREARDHSESRSELNLCSAATRARQRADDLLRRLGRLADPCDDLVSLVLGYRRELNMVSPRSAA